MILEAQGLSTDTTMQSEPTDFGELYRRRRLLKSTVPSPLAAADVAASSSTVIFTVAAGEEKTTLLQQFLERCREAIFRAGIISSATSSIDRAALERYVEAGPEAWRGIFSLVYQRKILLSESIELQTAKLPRLKPRVILDRHTLSREEDD